MANKGGGGSTIVGYRYYMSIHMGISRGPLDAIVECRIGDIKAWGFPAESDGSPVTANGIFNIDKPDLFGGEEKEGGIRGSFAVMMGEDTQTCPSEVSALLTGLVPGFRGTATIMYYGLVSVNNPYPKAWKWRVQRALKGWMNDDPWYPAKAVIITGDVNSAVLTFTQNPVPGDFVLFGVVPVHFNTAPISGIDVIIGATNVDTAAAFAAAVNTNTVTLGNATAVATGNTVEIHFDDDPAPELSQVGYVQIAATGGTIKAMNPAHIIYQCATDKAWGRGLPASMLDEDAFTVVADTLSTEGFGLCIRWNREDDIDKFVQSILNHIGASLYINRQNGKLTLDLIRYDYDPGDLPVFTFGSGLLDIVSDDSAMTDTSYNEIVVTYHDPVIDQDGQVRVHDLASIHSIGSTISTTVDYPGIPTASLATRVAQRDLEMQSNTLRRFKVVLDRSAWRIQPGKPFIVVAPSRGMEDGLILRAGRIEDSAFSDGKITIEAVEDVFRMPDTSVMGVEKPAWVQPDRKAHAVTVRRIEEMTYRDLAANLTAADLNTVNPDQSAIKTLAKRPTELSQDYVVATELDGEADFAERGVNAWEPSALLDGSIDLYETNISFGSATDMIGVVVGGQILIENEYCRLDDIDVGAGTAVIARGVMDTIPVGHASGVRIWFEDSRPGGDGREYAVGELLHVKLLTRSSSEKLKIADAPTDDITFAGRQGRPYPPGNVRVNGDPFGDMPGPVANVDDIVITWAHRDRITQGNFLLEHGAASTGPEASTVYNLRIYNGVTLLHDNPGLTGDTYTYLNATIIADGDLPNVRFELESERSGYLSWQKYDFVVARVP